MKSAKGITSAIFNVLTEMASGLEVVFSRKSFYEKSMMLEFGFKPWQVNRVLKGLEDRQYLVNRNNKFFLTRKGEIKLNHHQLAKIKLCFENKWDSKWRLIIFDIPEHVREVRDALRGKLREWNCYKVQNSVFVCPFDCRKEIAQICTILKAHAWIHIFLIDQLGSIEPKVKKYYNL